MTKNKIKVLGTFVCITVTVAAVIFSFKLYREHLIVRNKMEENKIELQETEAEIEMITQYIEEYNTEKEEFEKYLFSEQDIPAFLDGLAEIATKSSVNILDMKTQRFRAVKTSQSLEASKSELQRRRKAKKKNVQVKKTTTLAAMPIRIRIEGNYGALIKFFDRLEEFEQLLSVSDINITRGGEYPTIKCNFNLKIYSFKTLEEVAQG